MHCITVFDLSSNKCFVQATGTDSQAHDVDHELGLVFHHECPQQEGQASQCEQDDVVWIQQREQGGDNLGTNH